MREIISLHLGQCGNRIATSFWNKIAKEHGVNKQRIYEGMNPDIELRYSGVFFREGLDSKHTPRAILIDTEPSAMNSILVNDHFDNFYAPQNLIDIESRKGVGNCWATGFELGSSVNGIGSHVFDIIHTEIETCDNLQGFQMTHSLGGGTGSGFGAWLYEALRDELPEIILTSFSINQSNISNVVVEPYNSVLSLNTLQEDVDGVYLFDNDALCRICVDRLKIPNPTFDDMNELISDILSGITCSLRFPGQHNTSLRKQMTNLVPDPRFHLFVCSQAPLTSHRSEPSVYSTIATDLATDLFKQQNMMLSGAGRRSEKILAAAAIFRGQVGTHKAEEAMSQIQSKERYRFSNFLSNSIHTSFCDIPPPSMPLSATCVINSTIASVTLRRALDAASALFSKGAYLHHYDNAISNAQCIKQSIDLLETVYRDHIDLECLLPSDDPIRRPRAMGKGSRIDDTGSNNASHRHDYNIPLQHHFGDGQASTTPTTTTTNATPNSPLQ